MRKWAYILGDADESEAPRRSAFFFCAIGRLRVGDAWEVGKCRLGEEKLAGDGRGMDGRSGSPGETTTTVLHTAAAPEGQFRGGGGHARFLDMASLPLRNHFKAMHFVVVAACLHFVYRGGELSLIVSDIAACE